MITRPFYYLTKSEDPHYTLALEESMLNRISSGEIILYLYTHKNSVIIGKNQNAWAECRHDLLSREEGKLARRISGGGAVFHDTGNLNFSFIVYRKEYDLHRQLSVILAAVQSFGIKASFSGRNDIVVDGKKFSGNAFCHRKEGSFHHGTILIDVNKGNLAKYLQVSKEKIESKGVASVRSRVCNLTEYNPEVNIQAMTDALIRAFEKEYGKASPYRLPAGAADEAAALARRNAQWEWLFGTTPRFDITLSRRFEWGGVEIGFALKNGFTEDAIIFSDAMDADFIGRISAAMVGIAFKSDILAEKINAVPYTDDRQKSILEDLRRFILKKSF